MLAFAGDTIPCNISPEAYLNAFINVMNLLKENDCDKLIFNLESAMATRESIPLDTGSSCVYGEKEILHPVLNQFGDSLSCSLANNHITDYGVSALSDTLDLLQRHGVGYFGAGPNHSEALKPQILVGNGVSIGMLSVCSSRKCVGDHLQKMENGPLSLLDDTVLNQIESLKNRVDHVVIACHWGKEFVHYPLPEDRVLAKSFIDAGASLVVGHHPHVLQGYEYYGNGLIIYSLGNFLFPSQISPQILRWSRIERTSVIAFISFNKSTIKLQSFNPFRLEKSNLLIFFESREKDKLLVDITKWSYAFSLRNYETFFDRKMRVMILWRIAKGIFRNLAHPRRQHFVMIYRHFKQLFMGRKYYINE